MNLPKYSLQPRDKIQHSSGEDAPVPGIFSILLKLP